VKNADETGQETVVAGVQRRQAAPEFMDDLVQFECRPQRVDP
jgi:hypothetical protein